MSRHLDEVGAEEDDAALLRHAGERWAEEEEVPPRARRSRRQWLRDLMAVDRRQLCELAFQWRWLILASIVSALMGFIMWLYRRQLLTALEELSKKVHSMGASGYVLIAALIFLSAFPPIIGYGTYQTLSGFTFGFAQGFPISYFSALFGAVTCFLLSKLWLRNRVKRVLSKHPNLEAVVKAVEKKGFKLFVLIRLSPYPFGLLNVLFASTGISVLHYSMGTAISLVKIALHVYIGANLTSFAKHVLGEEEKMTDGERQAQTVRYVIMALGSILGFGVMAYIYVIAKKAVKEVANEEAETLAFLGPRDADEEWQAWEESDEDHQVTRPSARPTV